MFRSTRHHLRGFGAVALALAMALFATAFAGPAGADADGYNPFAGNALVTLALWDQNAGAFVVNPAFNTAKPNAVRGAFDTTWASMKDTFCAQMEAGIKAGDGGFDGTNSCNPVTPDNAQLLAKNLGTNLIGLRYFVPGHDGEEYSYNHQGCFIVCADFNIAVSYDLTIDVVLRVAPGVGPEADGSTPISVQSAQLRFSNSFFRTTGEIGCGDDCHHADHLLDSKVVDITSLIGMSDVNTELHSNIALIPAYYGLGATADADNLNLAVRKDSLPTLDPNLPLSTATFTLGFGRVFLPEHGVWGVDTSGVLWQQTGILSFDGHWFNDNKPAGTKLVSGPAVVVGSDQSRQVFATAANGHLYNFNGTQWQDRGLPPGTTAVGTPAAGANGTVDRVVVRGANGHIELLYQNSATNWQWIDLGSPGGTTTFNPALLVSSGYMALVVTKPNGDLAQKEFLGTVSTPWKDLGAFASPAASSPSMLANGLTISAYVTGANGAVEVASFPIFGTASLSGIPALLFNTLPTASGAPSVSMLNGNPTIFVADTTGNVWQMTYTTISFGRFQISGYGASNDGSLLGASMRAPTALNAFGGVSGFSVATNGHVGQTHNFGSRTGLTDHNALSRVVYMAHAQPDPIVIGNAAKARSSVVIRPISEWGPVMNEGQTDTSSGLFQTYPDAFRFQATQAGSVMCTAYVETVGWQAEVGDGQVCGSIDQKHHITAIRLRLADAPAGMHLTYRCLAGTWSAWISDGAGCGATNFNVAVTAVQVQYSDTPVPEISYRTVSEDGNWQPWADDGAVAGIGGTRLVGFEVHSNVGGNLRCAAFTSSDGWHLGVDDDSVCGNVDSSQSMEAFRLFLSGGPAGEHIEYRAFVSGQGWTAWAADGNPVGTPSSSAPRIEQIQVQAFR